MSALCIKKSPVLSIQSLTCLSLPLCSSSTYPRLAAASMTYYVLCIKCALCRACSRGSGEGAWVLQPLCNAVFFLRSQAAYLARQKKFYTLMAVRVNMSLCVWQNGEATWHFNVISKQTGVDLCYSGLNAAQGETAMQTGIEWVCGVHLDKCTVA